MTDRTAARSTLTIAILSSHCLVRMGLQKILESSTTLPMVVLPYSGRISGLLCAERCPDLFILDLETERDALGAITQIREAVPTSKIVLLCGLEVVDRAGEAFAAGVDGIILKVQPPIVVLTVIEALYAPAASSVRMERASQGEIVLGTPIKTRGESAAPLPAWSESLTEREQEVVRLVRQGLSNKDIADELSISDKTVRHHMTNIFDKVGVPNRQKLLLHTHHVCPTSV